MHSLDSFSTWNVVADINFSSSGKRWNIHNNVSSVEKLMKFTMASWDTYILHPDYSRGDWIWWEFFILELLLEKWTLGSQHHFVYMDRSVHLQLGMITLQIMPNILFNWKTMWTMINSLILGVGLLNSTVICGKQTHASHDLVWCTFPFHLLQDG